MVHIIWFSLEGIIFRAYKSLPLQFFLFLLWPSCHYDNDFTIDVYIIIQIKATVWNAHFSHSTETPMSVRTICSFSVSLAENRGFRQLHHPSSIQRTFIIQIIKCWTLNFSSAARWIMLILDYWAILFLFHPLFITSQTTCNWLATCSVST